MSIGVKDDQKVLGTGLATVAERASLIVAADDETTGSGPLADALLWKGVIVAEATGDVIDSNQATHNDLYA